MPVPRFSIAARDLAEWRRVLAGMAAALDRREDDLSRRADQLAKLTGDLDALERRWHQLLEADGEQAELLSDAIEAAWHSLEGDLARLSSGSDDSPDHGKTA